MKTTPQLSPDLYYTAPTQEIFDEVKSACIRVWRHPEEYDMNSPLHPDYAADKIAFIESLEPNQMMAMLQRFHMVVRKKVMRGLSNRARDAIRLRMLAGGAALSDINYLGI